MNILLMILDDWPGHTAWSMPTIDAELRVPGARYDHISSSPLCSPSRATLLTAWEARHHGIRGNGSAARIFADTLAATSMPAQLKNLGVHTAMLGKPMNNYYTTSANSVYPTPFAGWSRWFVFKSPDNLDATYSVDGVETFVLGYSLGVLATEAERIIRNVPEPFFIAYWPYAPHDPISEPEDVGKFKTDLWHPPSFNEADVTDKPPRWQLALLTSSQITTLDIRYRKTLRHLQAVDRAFAKMLGALTETGRLANTLIILTGDQGVTLGEHRHPGAKKSLPWQPVLRTPLYIRGPGVNSVVAGSRNHLVATQDIAATILAAYGIADLRDGLSLWTSLGNPTAAPKREDVLFQNWSTDRFDGLRTRNAAEDDMYCVLQGDTGGEQFYDLTVDPDEMVSLHAEPSYEALKTVRASRLTALLAS